MKLNGHQDREEPEGRVRRRVAGEPSLPVFRSQGGCRRFNDVSAVFRSTAEGETAMRMATRVPRAGGRSGHRPAHRRDQLNLKAAIAGETHEYTDMYPGMAKRRATKASARSPTGSRPWPRPSARTPIASRRRWTTCNRPRTYRQAWPRGSRTRGRGSRAKAVSRPRPAIRSTGAKPEFYDEAALDRNWSAYSTSATAAGAASACAQPSRRCSTRSTRPPRWSRRRRQEGLLEGRRPLLPVRHVLHDQVPVRAAASLERGFPAPDAARQGGASSRRASSSFRERVLSSTDAVGRIAGIPVVVQTVNAAEQERARTQAAGQDAGRASAIAPLPESCDTARSRLKRPLRQRPRTVQATARHSRQGGALHDLLRQPQRARLGAGPGGGIRAQRHAVRAGAEGALLRHAQAGTGRFEVRRAVTRRPTSRGWRG